MNPYSRPAGKSSLALSQRISLERPSIGKRRDFSPEEQNWRKPVPIEKTAMINLPTCENTSEYKNSTFGK